MKHLQATYKILPNGNSVIDTIDIPLSNELFSMPYFWHLNKTLPLSYKVFQISDYQRKVVCIRTDAYPLLWIAYVLLFWLAKINDYIKGWLWFVLVFYCNNGVDFVPQNELAGNYYNILKHFLAHKLYDNRTK